MKFSGRFRRFHSITVLLILAGVRLPLFAGSLVDAVNPMIGASTSVEYGEGKTFPGAATPFGLVQLSPDTITGGDNGSGYSYEHKSIEGFSFTHMSGIGWYGDLGNFLVMPTTGPLKTERGVNGSEDGYRSRFRHETEVAQAGYYAVTLDDYHIRAEAAAAPHAGILRFTFPQADQSRIQIDLARRIGGTSTRQYVKVVDDHTIQGWMKCPPAGGGWGDGAGKADYTVYFYTQFSRPITNCGVWSVAIPKEWSRKREDIESKRYRDVVAAAKVAAGCREMEGDHLGFYFEFASRDGEQVSLKTGISFASLEGAKQNLEHDISGWDFDSIHEHAKNLWKDTFAGIETQGGTPIQREAFATALYHVMLDPRAYSDVNGDYTGSDGKIHRADNFTYRTIFSGWDVFRSQYPLLTIIRPDVVNDTVNSLMQQAQLSGNGYLARWEILTAESGCMIGDPAVSVFADAYLKGIRGYDVNQAYELCRKSVELDRDNGNHRPDYRRLGFAPESISVTLENAYFDYCAGKFAEALGNTNDARRLMLRSQSYRNIYDPSVGNMHARKADGSWTAWRGATTEGQGCVESNPYQQGWFVPQDVAGLMDLMRHDYFVSHLTDFFEKTPLTFKWNQYYNHANEPVHHVAYLFTYAGKPWLSQKWARIVMDHAYGAGVKGLCGNEDVGQMSAWYILSAIGFHPVSPVDGIYVIGSPLFDEVTLRLDSKYYPGRTFTVRTRNNSVHNMYIQSALLNGKPLKRAWLRHSEIINGGTLELTMGPEPNEQWGSAPEDLPPRNF
ncbi:MAG TPA: GH92 family glycosyl hydrolase [Verrucomicrobiae bacterium]|jgi:predicted alpha-1,2-mannosidase|nr:GH92 family glycosyl hydrolase [Verrucomicrobiae bacterium]